MKTETKQVPASKKVQTTKQKTMNLFVFKEIMRPSHGKALLAHTLAALQVLGMTGPRRPAVAEAALTKVIGARAVRYHSEKTGNMEATALGSIRLTEEGVNFFNTRVRDGRVEQGMVDGYVTLLKTGENPALRVRKASITPVTVTL